MVEQPAADLVKALARFESGFSYPLGQKTKFRISHGEDYPRFFRAMGQCRVFVSERHGEVSGTLAGVVRTLDGSEKEGTNVLYVGDLKVEPGLIAGLTLLRLAAALKSWAEPQVKAAVRGKRTRATERTSEQFRLFGRELRRRAAEARCQNGRRQGISSAFLLRTGRSGQGYGRGARISWACACAGNGVRSRNSAGFRLAYQHLGDIGHVLACTSCPECHS